VIPMPIWLCEVAGSQSGACSRPGLWSPGPERRGPDATLPGAPAVRGREAFSHRKGHAFNAPMGACDPEAGKYPQHHTAPPSPKVRKNPHSVRRKMRQVGFHNVRIHAVSMLLRRTSAAEFQDHYPWRAGIEGTHTQATRRCGFRLGCAAANPDFSGGVTVADGRLELSWSQSFPSRLVPPPP
jgi:hypothetical protein